MKPFWLLICSIEVLATHDQITKGGMYIGAKFPANRAYRQKLIDSALLIARDCAIKGVRGIFSIDFLAVYNQVDRCWSIYYLELNLRSSATTHAYFWSKGLTNSKYDDQSGYLVHGGDKFVYASCEYFHNPRLSTYETRDLINMLQATELDYDHRSKCGVLIHMTGTLKTFSKFGATVIGRTSDEVDHITRKLHSMVNAL